MPISYTELMYKIEARAKRNGEDKILDLIQEECAEVIQAISKFKRDSNEANYMEIFEELVDVVNLKIQLQCMSGKSDEEWDTFTREHIYAKLERQDQREKELR